jgi:hypothetical protein
MNIEVLLTYREFIESREDFCEANLQKDIYAAHHDYRQHRGLVL